MFKAKELLGKFGGDLIKYVSNLTGKEFPFAVYQEMLEIANKDGIIDPVERAILDVYKEELKDYMPVTPMRYESLLKAVKEVIDEDAVTTEDESSIYKALESVETVLMKSMVDVYDIAFEVANDDGEISEDEGAILVRIKRFFSPIEHDFYNMTSEIKEFLKERDGIEGNPIYEEILTLVPNAETLDTVYKKVSKIAPKDKEELTEESQVILGIIEKYVEKEQEDS